MAESALPLLRRWVNDYFNRHDDAAARAFIAPDYALHIGDVVFAGRDDHRVAERIPKTLNHQAVFAH